MKKILAVVSLLAYIGVSQTMGQTMVLNHADGATTNETVALVGDVNNDGAVNVGDIMAVINIMAGGTQPAETAFLTCSDGNHPHMIDLGLPSGTKWACCNVGASTPEDAGGHYAWGETSEKSTYNWDTYQYGYYDYSEDYSLLENIGSDIAGTQYDAATANWGVPWRMPSLAQITELLDNCSSAWITQNGVDGRKFTGPNGGTIFLPAAGCRLNSNPSLDGSSGFYWSSSLFDSYPYCGWYLYFDSKGLDWNSHGRDRGLSVRPVR